MHIVRFALLLALTTLANSLQAETLICTPITSLPAVISTQGIFCLTGNLATSITSGNAITITTNNVTLDLNGWKIGGQGAGTATLAYGIYSTADNITIKNGIVRGFAYGIDLTGRSATVQDVRLDQNTISGIAVTGQGAVVEHNQVVDTGGSTAAISAFGIFVSGSGVTVSDNVVSGLTATGTGSEYGIDVISANNVVRGNVVSDTAPPSGGGTSYGIIQTQSIAVNNTVSNFGTGINNSGGIYAHNTIYSCTTNYIGGTAGAGNSP